MSLSLSKCDFCKHYFFDKENKKMCCKAFPDGIPWENIPDDEDVECANGIKYENEDREYKEFVPDPNSILAKMHCI